MIRTQIQLTELLYETVRKIAFEEKQSMSETVRTLIERALDLRNAYQRKNNNTKKKPSFIASGASGKSDISEKHDHYLEEDLR